MTKIDWLEKTNELDTLLLAQGEMANQVRDRLATVRERIAEQEMILNDLRLIEAKAEAHLLTVEDGAASTREVLRLSLRVARMQE